MSADRRYPEPDLSLVGAEHIARYEETDGRIGHAWNDTQCLILHAVGRRSGHVIKHALIYGVSDDNYVIVGSHGGKPAHPQWYLNLVANPDVVVQVLDEVIPVHARTAVGSERERLWTLMNAEFPNYDQYQHRTERVIPIVVLERR